MLFDAINTNREDVEIHSGKEAIKIKIKLLSPLLQINVGGKNATSSETKKLYRKVKGIDYPIATPVYSANGIRGTLRRLALKSIDDIAKETDPFYEKQLSARTVNFYSSGNEKTIKGVIDLSYTQIQKLREFFPAINLFGAGLSFVEGTLCVSPFMIKEEDLVRETDENTFKPVTFIYKMSGVRFDEANRNSFLAPLIDEKSVKEWLKLNSDNQKETKRKKELLKKKSEELSDKEKKELKELEDVKNNSTQMLHEHEYVVPGIEMHGSISVKKDFKELTDIEKGLLFYVLTEFATSSLGSLKNKGYGVADWEISYKDYGNIIVENDSNYFLGEKKITISPKIKETIKKYKDWVVKNKVWEYLETEKLLKKVA